MNVTNLWPTSGTTRPMFTLAATVLGSLLWSATATAATPEPKAQTTVGADALQALIGGQVVVETRDGRKVEGRLVATEVDAVQVKTSKAPPVRVLRADIAQIRLVDDPAAGTESLTDALGETIHLRLADGRKKVGRLLGFTATTLTVVDADGRVEAMMRGDVVALTHGPPSDAPRVGVSLSVLPGVMVDLDVGLVRAYINASLFFPAVFSGRIWGLSAGAGVGIPVSPKTPMFKIDVLAQMSIMGSDSACSTCEYPTAYTYAFGLAVGVHTTLDNGFTAGLTVPIIGYSVTPEYKGSGDTAVGYYYLASAVGMPLGFLGYRF